MLTSSSVNIGTRLCMVIPHPDRPPNMPKPWGQGFIVSAYVNSDHAGDTVTRRSRTGFFIYCNTFLVYWMSKKQEYIETSSFGSEFLAMKDWTEYNQGLKFKLHIRGFTEIWKKNFFEK